MPPVSDPARPAVTVAVLTYRRLSHVAEILPMLIDQAQRLATVTGVPASVVVVDNDPSAGARAAIAALPTHGVRLRYIHERQPGIAAARNRALAAAAPAGLLVFIDDDERPSQDWLTTLVGRWLEWGCAAVAGPVAPDFRGVPVDPWVSASGAFARKHRSTGTVMAGAATNNLLLDMAVVSRLGLRFDERLGLTGGEDTMFTHTLIALGEQIRWCDEAEVTDLVAPERLNRRWVLRRTYRAGTSWSRMELQLAPTGVERLTQRVNLVARAAANMALGIGGFLPAYARRDIAAQARSTCRVVSYAGLFSGALGMSLSEYGRRAPAAATPTSTSKSAPRRTAD